MGLFLTLLMLAMGFVLIYYGLFWVILGVILIIGIIKLANGD